MLQGRDFSRDYNDSLSVIINQSAVDFMGMKDPIGKKIIYNKKYYVLFNINFNTL